MSRNGHRHGRLRGRVVQDTLLCAVFALAGCSSLPEPDPVEWWHHLQGGAIAEQRPEPPGATDPYPNLGTVPARPAPIDRVAQASLSERLAVARDTTERAAAADPLVAPATGAAAAGAGQQAAGLPAPGTATISAPAASASSPPAPSPTAPFPTAAPAPAASASAAAAAPAAAGTAMLATPPALAAAPPAAAELTGPLAVAIPPPASPPPASPRPASPPPPAAAPAAVAAAAPPNPPQPNKVTLYFRSDQSVLSSNGPTVLNALAARRGTRVIEVIGYGEAASEAPAAQQAALVLALKRAQTVAASLLSDGVPASALHVRALPFGRDATATLLD